MVLWASGLEFFTENTRVYSANLSLPSDCQTMPFTWLSDFKIFPCKPTNTLSFGRSHIIRSVSSFLFCSQIHSIIICVLLSILIRPDLVGDLQWQVGPWLLFYYDVAMLRPCLCFRCLFSLPPDFIRFCFPTSL